MPMNLDFWKLLAGLGIFLFGMLLIKESVKTLSGRAFIRTKGLPSQMEILEPLNANIQVTLRGLRRDASILDKEKVMAELDLSRARPGKMDFNITRNEIRLPDDRVKLVDVEPSKFTFVFKKAQKSQKPDP